MAKFQAFHLVISSSINFLFFEECILPWKKLLYVDTKLSQSQCCKLIDLDVPRHPRISKS